MSDRIEAFASTQDALLAAVTFSILLAALVAGFFVVRQVDEPARPVVDRDPATEPRGSSEES